MKPPIFPSKPSANTPHLFLFLHSFLDAPNHHPPFYCTPIPDSNNGEQEPVLSFPIVSMAKVNKGLLISGSIYSYIRPHLIYFIPLHSFFVIQRLLLHVPSPRQFLLNPHNERDCAQKTTNHQPVSTERILLPS